MRDNSGATLPNQKRARLSAQLLLAQLLLILLSVPNQLAAQTQIAPGSTAQNHLYLPLALNRSGVPRYESIRTVPPSLQPAADVHGDVNLALRGYGPTTAELGLVNINGPTDSDAPQLSGLFFPQRRPQFIATHRVNKWDWNCGENGCRTEPITWRDVTLLSLNTTPNEPIFIPTRRAQIMAGAYIAMVLYAAEERITLVYTRDDTPAFGYVVHLENVQIDAELLTLYQASNAAGRTRLPALRNNQQIGVAAGETIKVAIRDTGRFMDPRSRKDWWRGY